MVAKHFAACVAMYRAVYSIREDLIGQIKIGDNLELMAWNDRLG